MYVYQYLLSHCGLLLSLYEVYIVTELSHLYMDVFAYVAYMWQLRGIFVVDTCMAIAW